MLFTSTSKCSQNSCSNDVDMKLPIPSPIGDPRPMTPSSMDSAVEQNANPRKHAGFRACQKIEHAALKPYHDNVIGKVKAPILTYKDR